jgi:hypothetical protein
MGFPLRSAARQRPRFVSFCAPGQASAAMAKLLCDGGPAGPGTPSGRGGVGPWAPVVQCEEAVLIGNGAPSGAAFM